MAYIEIKYEVYKNLTEKINDLEKENVSLKHQIEELENIINDNDETISDVIECSFFERIFSWKKIIQDFKEKYNSKWKK